MKRKRNLIISVSCALAFFLALTGCSKGDSTIEQQPVNVEDNNEVVQPIEEQPEQQVEEQVEPQIKTGFTDELFAHKKAQLVYPTANLHYAGESNVDATNGNVTELLSLDPLVFTATYARNNGSSPMGLKTSSIWMYGYKQDGAKGNKLTVSIASGYTIKSIRIDYIEPEKSYMAEISSGGLMIDGTNGFYTIGADSFMIFINNSSVDTNTPIKFRSIVIEYEYPTAKEAIEYGLLTSSSLSYEYTKEGDGAVDELTKLTTGATSSYIDWEHDSLETRISYNGNNSGGNNSIQLRASNGSGVTVTANPNDHDAKMVIIKWNTNTPSGESQAIQIYGKNEAYSGSSDLFSQTNAVKGTLIGTLLFDSKNAENETSLSIDTSYKYIGIRLKAGSSTAYVDSISIQWGNIPVFAYSDAAIRFGGLIDTTLWNTLNTESTITGYGVMLSTPEYLSSDLIEEKFGVALASEGTIDAAITLITDGSNIKNFYSEINGERLHPAEATAAQKTGLDGDYYIWNLYKRIPEANLTSSYTAVAYIRTANHGMVFLNEVTASAKSLAGDLIDNDTNDLDEDSFDGSLGNLANLA